MSKACASECCRSWRPTSLSSTKRVGHKTSRAGPMIDFLFSLPLWLLAAILNAWLMGFGLLGLWVVRRWILPRMSLRYDDAYFGAAVVQSAMLLYGLIAALTAVAVWQRHTQAFDIVSGEATAIATLWRDLSGYPAPQR